MNPLLVIWTARRIPTVHLHLRALTGIDKVWVFGHTEEQLADAIPALLMERPGYTHAMLVPDDLVVSQQAVDSVLRLAAEYEHTPTAVGGWSNCDFKHPYTNIGLTVLEKPRPDSMKDYGHLLRIDELAGREMPFRARFCGHTLFTMPRELWLDDATRLLPLAPTPGWGSDYHQCYRLGVAGVEVWIDPLAFAGHLKMDHLVGDSVGWKQLYLSDQRIEWEVAR